MSDFLQGALLSVVAIQTLLISYRLGKLEKMMKETDAERLRKAIKNHTDRMGL